jgi:hypothetical protein
MADTLMAAMVMPGVGHGQGLEDTANRLTVLGLEEEVEVIRHQAVAEEAEGIAQLGLAQGIQERLEVVVPEENGEAVVAPVEGVVEQAVSDGSRLASHVHRLWRGRPNVNKMN